MAPRDSDANLLRGFYDLTLCRDKPASLRSSGGGNGIGWGLSHRIWFDEVWPILPWRIHRDDNRFRDCCNIIPRRLAFPWYSGRISRVVLGPNKYLRFLRQGH